MSEINEIAAKQIEKIKKDCKKIKPIVAILCITFNHELYIRDALEGFVMQKTDFPFVAIVHDDASTDGTANIIREYAEKYPDIIKPIIETENQYSKRDGSLRRVMNEACDATGAKYIAMCEGDDYWIDPLKLQKQVDFLESHKEYGYVCHRYRVRNHNDIEIIDKSNYIFDTNPKLSGYGFDLEYAFKAEWITKTLTALFRLEYLLDNPLSVCRYYKDIHLVYNILSHTKGCCMNFYGGVYRKQETGVWSQLREEQQFNVDLDTWREINRFERDKLSRYEINLKTLKVQIYNIKNKKRPILKNLEFLKALLYYPVFKVSEYFRPTIESESKRILKSPKFIKF